MARYWGAKVREVQRGIRDRILAERTIQLASLPAALQGADFHVAVAADPHQAPNKPYTVQVLPPERSNWEGETTMALEASLEFRLIVEIRTPADVDKAALLQEVQGLIIDALQVDPSLGGLVSGFGSPAISLHDLVAGPGIVAQEVGVRLIVRG